jgi:two-component system nitrate/nitrite response regulator NarL
MVRQLHVEYAGKDCACRVLATVFPEGYTSARTFLRTEMRRSSARPRRAIRVVVADRTRMNCELVATSLRASSRRFDVVGSATSASELRKILNQESPEVALISSHLEDGPGAGFDVVREVRNSFPLTRPIILLDSMEPRMIIRSFQVGAKGIFSRDKSIDTLRKCIEVVDSGQIWASTSELQILLEMVARRSRLGPMSPKGTKILSGKENEIANLVTEGLRNSEIAEKLSLSTHTVKNYLYRVYDKLGISSRVELVTYILTPEAPEPRGIPIEHRR